MNDPLPFIKYIFLAVLFLFAFIAVFSEKLELVGFGSIFTISIFYLFCLFFDIYKDKERSLKTFSFPAVKLGYTEISEISLPLFGIITPLALINFRNISSLGLSIWRNVSRYGILRISKANRSKLEQEKWMILVTVFVLLALTFLYMLYGKVQLNNNALRLGITMCILFGYVLSIISLILEIVISGEMVGNTTDG
jgi:hypothetical protein